jgi:hypothetical protein
MQTKPLSRRFQHYILGLCLSTFGVVIPSFAQSVPLSEKAYIGKYRHGSVDTVEELALLGDHTFCFAAMAGSLDLKIAGRWKPIQSPNGELSGIQIDEIKPDKPVFPAFVEGSSEKAPRVVFEFHGYSLAEAAKPVFGVSSTDLRPATLRPLFPEEHNDWAEFYKLPAMNSAQVHYFFIGQIAQNGSRESDSKLMVTEYALKGAGRIRIAFDNVQALPAMHKQARLEKDQLDLENENMGEKEDLGAEQLSGIQKNCIQPILNPSATQPEDSPQRAIQLTPIKTFEMDKSAIQGSAWFAGKPGLATQPSRR